MEQPPIAEQSPVQKITDVVNQATGEVTSAPLPPNVALPPTAASQALATAADAQLASGGGDDAERAISAFSSESSFAAAVRMAKALSQSSLMPSAYQGNIPNCLIALELAHRIGASVLMVAQNLDIIHNRPSWRAQFLIATVNSSRRFTPIRFRFEGKIGTDDWGCRAVAKDKSTGEECVGPLVTIRLAKAEDWYSKKGSKWQTLPELMLHYRSAAFWARVYAPELSLGMATSEEIVDTTGETLPETPSALSPGSIGHLESALAAKP
jgi:hypothetical protein